MIHSKVANRLARQYIAKSAMIGKKNADAWLRAVCKDNHIDLRVVRKEIVDCVNNMTKVDLYQ